METTGNFKVTNCFGVLVEQKYTRKTQESKKINVENGNNKASIKILVFQELMLVVLMAFWLLKPNHFYSAFLRPAFPKRFLFLVPNSNQSLVTAIRKLINFRAYLQYPFT